MTAINGNARAAAILLAHGADANATDANQQTPLHIACRLNKKKVVKELTQHGADVNIRDFLQMTPIHLACEPMDGDIAIKLIEHGADLTATDLQK